MPPSAPPSAPPSDDGPGPPGADAGTETGSGAGAEAGATLPDERTRRGFVSHMRHELRTPINAIIGYSELLLEDAEDCGYQGFVDDLRRVRDAGRGLLARVGELLDPTRFEDGGTPVDLGHLTERVHLDLRTPIASIIGYVEMLLEDSQDRHLEDLVEDLGKVRGAAERMLAYVEDIVDLPRIASGELPLDPGHVAAGAVRETIEAIPPLPEAPPEPEAPEAGTILVVDDNETNRHLLCRRLRRRGHRTVDAQSGEQALELLAEGGFDLVLLDIIMPGLNGVEVLRRIKADPRLRHVPIVMLTSLDQVEGVVACIQQGADDYLTRPINPVILDARIGACLEKKFLRDLEQARLEQLRVEREKSERLLLNILPGPIADRLKERESIIVDSFPDVTVLFADLVGFTKLSAQVSPEELIALLNRIFSTFDRLAERHGVEKIKTIGDAYMAVAGMLTPVAAPARAVAELALDMIDELDRIARRVDRPLQLRVGINTGPVIAGVIGRSKFIYDLWGDTVNTASRMESHGRQHSVHITETTRAALGAAYRYEERGTIEVKGKGPMQTAFLVGRA